ncbi:succinate dehydrogenase, cytochrome b556 subunit [Hyphomonas sp.]|uniref:succinate dehydrogenase, cytochrome b556 subunit n=1 Tax=Hyphomonas sp. TaxID=87 RepID=UPI00352790C9
MSGSSGADARPLSPHLQVWRPHVTMAASITHRITGVALYFGTFLIAGWIIALATGAECYDAIEGILFSWYGSVILYLWAVAVLFHLVNGIRHLLWDGPNLGFDPGRASAVSVFNYAFAILGAAAIWFAAAGL